MQVYVDPLTAGDLLFITSTLYPECDKDMLRKMIAFNSKVTVLLRIHMAFYGYTQSYYNYLSASLL